MLASDVGLTAAAARKMPSNSQHLLFDASPLLRRHVDGGCFLIGDADGLRQASAQSVRAKRLRY